MKGKDIKTLRTKSDSDLKKEVSKLKIEFVKLTAEKSAGKSVNPKKLREVKKEIAIMKTLLTEKRIMKNEEVKEKEENK